MFYPVLITAALALWSTPLVLAFNSVLTATGTDLHPAAIVQEKTSLPTKKPGATTPELSAKAAYAYDRGSGSALYQKNSAQSLPIASITKLATAMVIVHRHQPDQIVTIPKLPVYGPEDELIGLKTGDRYKIRDLLTAMLVGSANDAADSLAIIDSGSREAFAGQMNQLMQQWGISGALFSNPSGLSDAGNSASAAALAQIGLLALKNQTIQSLASKQTGTITSQSGQSLAVTTTNQLLQTGLYQGIKTGYTAAAGQCFVGLTTINGREVVTVVLGSDDRFGETQTLRNWIKNNYTWQ